MNVKEILGRIKRLEKIRFDNDLTTVFDASINTINNWKQRGSIPIDHLVQYSKRTGYSLDYLVFGEGPLRSSTVVQSPAREGMDQMRLYRIAAMVYSAIREQNASLPTDQFERVLHSLNRMELEGMEAGPETIEEMLVELG